MANRIAIRPEGMKISMPGVDVFSAGPQQLLFDSDFGGITVGARGAYWVGGYGDYYIGLPRHFPETALIMVEASGHVMGGCRTVGQARDFYIWNWFWSRWTVSLVNSSTLLIRHTDYNTDPAFAPTRAGPGFPYVVNYAVLDA